MNFPQIKTTSLF